jgi:hypothetical protein
MRFRLVLGSAVAAMVAALCACDAILGIDDGIPRGEPDATLDAPLDAPKDALGDAPATDAGPDSNFVKLKCGTNVCDFSTGQQCCRTGTTTYVCQDAGSACTGTKITCDRPELCAPGDAGPVVCCADLTTTDAGPVASLVSCKLASACPINTAHTRMCDDAGQCGDAAACIQSTTTLPGYDICK